jgi:periplasmic copper chaperone A
MKILIALLFAFAGTAGAADGIRLAAEGGWVRAAPPGARAMAGYITLRNEADQPLRLVEASSAAFEAVEIHESYEEGGMARMRAIPALEIPAGGSVALVPGGLHLMLMRPLRPVAEGSTIIVDLVTASGDPLPVVLTVRRAADETADPHAGHHH